MEPKEETISQDDKTPSGQACSTSNAEYRVLVCQLGAREHYLVARCFANLGLLACLATDFWSPAGHSHRRILRCLPKAVVSALGRYHPELEGQRVASFPSLGVARYGLALFDKTRKHEQIITRRFARAVGNLNIQHNVFFGYSDESLELLREERRNGVFTILCQTDPGPAHYRMIGEEEKQWPQYVTFRRRRSEQERADRLRKEWDLADVLIVNSTWTQDSIVSAGAPASKIEILPLAYGINAEKQKEESRKPKEEISGQKSEISGQKSQVSLAREMASPISQAGFSFSASRPLKVLWVGNVALGKGIQYLVEAARLLAHEPVEFVVAGSMFIASAITKTAPANIRWLGRIPRSATSELYGECDVFVFPTLSDGFGITQLEALAHGLPVITTPNCGRAVEEGKTGYIIPPRDSQALADAILHFVHDPTLAHAMAPACRDAVKAFSVETYAKRLLEIIEKHFNHRTH